MGQFRPLFVYFHSFLIKISIQIEKSVDGVLWIWTRGGRMVGADETMELWQPPSLIHIFPTLFFICLNPPHSHPNGFYWGHQCSWLPSVWPDWAIYWTLGIFLKPLEIINLSKIHTFLANFCKGVKVIHFSFEIIFGQLL